MQRDVRSAEPLLDRLSHGMQVHDLGAVPCAVVPGPRCEPDGSNAVLEPQPAHHLHGIRVELDASTHTAKGGSLLVDLRGEPELTQGGSSSKSCNAGTHNGNCGRVPRHNALRSAKHLRKKRKPRRKQPTWHFFSFRKSKFEMAL